ncbi:MAG TPA: hypothetical protein VFN80_06815 [Acidothermaceae bacterium]|nr:hypothetical protein [Acidothermaceae bacterium]
MTVTTDKIADAVGARADAIRHQAKGGLAKAIAQAEKAREHADKARMRADKAQAKLAGKLAGKTMIDKSALKARMAKRVTGMTAGAGKVAMKSSAARSVASTAAKAAAMNLPAAWMMRRRMQQRASEAARMASMEASKQLKQARVLMQERVIPTVVPMASSMMDQASHKLDELKVSSAPARKEAMRRGMLAAAVLRGAEPLAKKGRRWPIAIMFTLIGAAIGAAAAWLSQAGKPVQLTPYPIPAEEGDTTVDLTSDDAAHHES